jgi:hypothetical protein
MSDSIGSPPPAPPEPPRIPASAAPPQRSGCLTAFMVLVGVILLLPGLCTMAFLGGNSSDPSMSLIALVTFLVAAGGIALIVFALRRPGR